MTEREIRTLRDKIGTDPILTDEEIEYIWMAMDKRTTMKVDEEWEEMSDDYIMVTIVCPSCGCTLGTSDPPDEKRRYCDDCGQKLDWED